MANKKTTTKKAPAKKTNAKKAEVKRDEFGLRPNTNTATAAAMFKKGCTMKQVTEKTGSPQYNVLKWLEAQGHKVQKKDGFITVTPKTA